MIPVVDSIKEYNFFLKKGVNCAEIYAFNSLTAINVKEFKTYFSKWSHGRAY